MIHSLESIPGLHKSLKIRAQYWHLQNPRQGTDVVHIAFNLFIIVQSNWKRAGIFKQSMGARNRVGIGLSYQPARLHRLAESIPWNRFLGSIKDLKCELRAGIFKKSMEARNRVGIGLSYRPARLHRLAEFIPWNQFLGSIKDLKYELRIGTCKTRVKEQMLFLKPLIYV